MTYSCDRIIVILTSMAALSVKSCVSIAFVCCNDVPVRAPGSNSRFVQFHSFIHSLIYMNYATRPT